MGDFSLVIWFFAGLALCLVGIQLASKLMSDRIDEEYRTRWTLNNPKDWEQDEEWKDGEKKA